MALTLILTCCHKILESHGFFTILQVVKKVMPFELTERQKKEKSSQKKLTF